MKIFYVEKPGDCQHTAQHTLQGDSCDHCSAKQSSSSVLSHPLLTVSLTCNHANLEGRCFHFHFQNPALAFPGYLTEVLSLILLFDSLHLCTCMYAFPYACTCIDNLFRWHYIVMLFPFTPPSQISILISAYQGAHSHSLVHKPLKAGVLKA